MMKAPGFWSRPPGLAALLLAPLAAIWTSAARRRQSKAKPTRVDVPVICVGNLTAGGTGKTPTVIALVERLHGMGRVPHVVSRGYGGSETGPLRVDEMRHKADAVGDEPLLLAAFAPTWVARDRVAGARAAIAAGADVIVLDDGFQNPALAKDISVVVIDAAAGFGNGRVMPAGPLREPVLDGMERADFALLIGDVDARCGFVDTYDLPVPLALATLQPLRTGMDWQGMRCVAFAGIGRPAKFFATLAGEGADILARHAFADHAPYRHDLLKRLSAEARALGAELVTTEKDAARLPAAYRGSILVLPVRLQIDDDAGLWAALEALNRAS